MRIGKYNFTSKEQFEAKRDALYELNDEGNKIPKFKFSLAELGHKLITKGEYDEEGNVLIEPMYSEEYLVDVAWYGLEDHPYGWKSYAIEIEDEGIHSFLGVSYQEHKF
jgi:hypothetical protein